MAQYVTLKRKKSDGGVEEIYPKTHIALLEGLSSGKIPYSYLPRSVTQPGSLIFQETISGDIANHVWFDLRFDSSGEIPKKGWFWIASAPTTLPNAGDDVIPNANLTYNISYVSKDDADNNLTLEKGDWLILNKINWDGHVSSPLDIEFAIINSTYEEATFSIPGVVKLGGATTISALSGNNVVTQTNLKTMFGEKQNTHARLSSISSLSSPPTNGTKVAISLTSDGIVSTGVYTPNIGEISLTTLADGHESGNYNRIMTGASLVSLFSNETRIHEGSWDSFAKTGDILIEDVV